MFYYGFLFSKQGAVQLAPLAGDALAQPHRRERRWHISLDDAMIKPWPQDEDGEVVMFARLGGFLKSYRRVRKKAA